MVAWQFLRRRRPRAATRPQAPACIGGGIMLICLVLHLLEGFPERGLCTKSESNGCFAQLPRHRVIRPRGRQGCRALRDNTDQQAQEEKAKDEAASLQFETVKFNMAWMKMKEAEEHNSPQVEALKRAVEEQGQVVEKLGGSLPAEMLTLEQSAEKVAKLKAELSFDNLWKMSNEERWILAQGLGPAFPIALILSYTLYWSLNVPFIAFAYFTTVANGQTTMAIVMTAAYATSIPFKPLVYIGALLGTPWTADTIMPLIGKFFGWFRLPNAEDFERL